MWNIDLKGKKVLIVGGTGNIGESIALEFLSAGAEVTVTAKSNKEIKKFQDNNLKKEITASKLDITNDISINEFLKSIDSLDVLVNCASITKGGLEYRIENFADVVNVNLMGLMRISHIMLPKLALTQGNIVNISSANTNVVFPTAPSYVATKGGIDSLTKSMAACWAEHKVRVNSVAPGWIEGKTANILKKDYKKTEDIIDRIPLKRFGKPSEVANAIIFLSSSLASYVSGATIFVDGGYSIN